MKANLLAAHIKNVHGTTVSISAGINVAEALTQQKQYPCQSCDKVFKLPHQLKQHALSSHVSNKQDLVSTARDVRCVNGFRNTDSKLVEAGHSYESRGSNLS